MERFKSLHVRIWLALGLIFITIVFVGMYVISFLYERLYVDEQINLLMTSGEELQSVYHNYDSESAFLWRVQWTDQSLGADVAFLTDEHPLITEGSSDNGSIHLDFVDAAERQALEAGETVVMLRNHPSYDQEILGVAIPLIENDELTGVILLSQPLASVYEPLAELRVLALVLLAIVIALLIVTGRVISLEAVKPIQQMQHTALKMAEGNFQERVHHQPRSIELKRLGESLNHLAQTLEEEEKNS
ncbi:HAMP domain-containing protein [Geomicrobium sp. JCM 19055]|uniref:HAMP domain-containing protein n=1 Tax=Geomicrobium sp. JCM 19055 TaxID=1460649 RepID=UPI0006932730|nr:HAMP domain-containing protein [Geomicrobium sp. JCM 19055]